MPSWPKFDGARVLVTHELLDAVALADRLVVLEQGRVAQEGSVADVVAQPRSRYVADLVGINLLRGIGRDHEVELETGGTVVTADPVVGDVYVAIHPHSVTLHLLDPVASARNVWRGRIAGTDLLGDRVRIHVDGEVPLVAEVTAAAVAELGLHDGVERLDRGQGHGPPDLSRLRQDARRPRRQQMKLSTRNQISGTVADVHVGEVMASVKVTLGSGETITAAITAEAVADLGLEPGKPVTVLVKATEVMLATD